MSSGNESIPSTSRNSNQDDEDVINISGTDSMKNGEGDNEDNNGGYSDTMYLLTNLIAERFMCFDRLEVSSTGRGTILYPGIKGSGKSAFIVAFLIGMGYDIISDDYIPNHLCGVDLSNIIQIGSRESILTTTLSLYSCPSLQKVFGRYLTIKRMIVRGISLMESPIELLPSDPIGNPNPAIASKHVTYKELRVTLEIIGINSKWLRIMLLDEANLVYMSENPSLWYGFYEDALKTNKRRLLFDFLSNKLLLDKIEGDIQWRVEASGRLKAQMKMVILDSPILEQSKKSDAKDNSLLRSSIHELRNRQFMCQNKELNYQKSLKDLEITYSYQMSKAYRDFLRVQNYQGDIVVDSVKEEIVIWILPLKTKGQLQLPKTIEEAKNCWRQTKEHRKLIAVMGLFLSLWRINESVPVFIIDSYTGSDQGFMLHENALPILMEIINEKLSTNARSEHQQFILTSSPLLKK